MKENNKETQIVIAHDGEGPFDFAEPERELLRAVLESALNDLKDRGSAGRRAKEYLLNPDEDYVFSFRSICSFLSVDPEQVLSATGISSQKEDAY